MVWGSCAFGVSRVISSAGAHGPIKAAHIREQETILFRIIVPTSTAEGLRHNGESAAAPHESTRKRVLKPLSMCICW